MKMALRCALAVFFWLAVSSSGFLEQAQATTVAPLDVEQLTDGATWIVRGVVQKSWTELDGDGHVWTRHRLDVKRVYKGPSQPSELVVDRHGGTHGDLQMHVWSAPRFSVGEEVVLFLDEITQGRLTPLAMHLGKYTVRRAPGEIRQHVVRFQVAPSQAYDARFIPHPPVHERFYLDDLLEKIDTRMRAGWDGRKIPGLSKERLKTINHLSRRNLR